MYYEDDKWDSNPCRNMFVLHILCLVSVLFYHLSDNFKLGRKKPSLDDTNYKHSSALRCGRKSGRCSIASDDDGSFQSRFDTVNKIDKVVLSSNKVISLTTSNSDTDDASTRSLNQSSSKIKWIHQPIDILNVDRNGKLNGNMDLVSNKISSPRSYQIKTYQTHANIRLPRGTEIRARVPKSNLTQICPYFECKENKYHMCWCDAECIHYCDCCHDAPYLFENNVQRCQELGQVLQCLVLPGQSYGMMGMMKCPQHNSTSEFRKLCDDTVYSVQNLPPVVDSNNMVYKNKHCAECHGITRVFDMQPGYNCPQTMVDLPSFLADHTVQEFMQLIQDSCQVHVFVSKLGLSTRMCAGYSDRTILMYGDLNATEDRHNMCPLYINPYTYQGRTFKNIHCLPPSVITNLDEEGCFSPRRGNFHGGFPISFIFNRHKKDAPTLNNKNKVSYEI